MRIGLFAASRRGLASLRHLLAKDPGRLAYVVTDADSSAVRDYAGEILAEAVASGIAASAKGRLPQATPGAEVRIAVGWRRLLPLDPRSPLIVLHDSLLPRYRGFAPLVSALINGESRLGVTALLAGEAYDQGPILAQEAVDVSYPLTIADAIERVIPCYVRLLDEIATRLDRGDFSGRAQDESLASYSLWRDEEDYRIPWTDDATRIVRFVDATGFPYRGASCRVDGADFRVEAATALEDIRLENRAPGKIFRLERGAPVVVCGRGLLRIDRMSSDGGKDALPWVRLKTRFA